MRIALVTQGYQIGGGVPAIARWLRCELVKRGHEVHVHDLATSSRDEFSRRVLGPTTWLRRLTATSDPSDAAVLKWGANWVEIESQRYRPRASLTAALDKYDLVQVVAGAPTLALSVSDVRTPKALQVATTLIEERRARLPGMPVGRRALKRLALPGLHRLELLALQSVDVVFVENRRMQGWVTSQGQPNVVFAPPGVDTETFRNPDRWDPRRPIIAFGRLGESRKDWPTSIEAYERYLAQTNAGNKLIVAGRGPMRPELASRIRTSPARSRIRVIEDVPASDLPSLLSSASVFLQSSLEEGLGLAGLEAMACGLPVVATATVGSKEYVADGWNGVLAPLGLHVAGDLAEGLALVLQEAGESMSANARRTAARYSQQASFGRFLSVYNQLTNLGQAS